MAADLNQVVMRIYEASVEPDGLDRLAGIIAEALGSRSGLLALLDRPAPGQDSLPSVVGMPSATANFDDWARTAYAEHYHHCNIWFERGVKRGFPAIVLSHELVPAKELLRSEWYDYCQRLDTFHVLGAQFHVDGQFSAQFGAQRPRRSRAFDEASRRKMALLLPHLQRALQIQLRLGLADEIAEATVDLLQRLGLGLLILDPGRRLLFGNALAERLLRDGSALRLSNGRVRAVGKDAAGFAEMVEQAARTSADKGQDAGGTLHLRAGRGSARRLLIAPLAATRCAFGISIPAVLVLISDPDEQPTASVEQLCAAFGLTHAEGLLLAGVVAGQSLADYAERTGIALETARTHAKRLLSKSGYHRQIDLVRAVTSDPMFRLAEAERGWPGAGG